VGGFARSRSNPYSSIRVTHRFSVPPDRVFDAWLDPAVAGKWLFATASRPIARVAIDARVEGSFRFVDRHEREQVEYSGEYVEIERPRRLAFTLSAPYESRVVVRILPRKSGCDLELIHENVPPDRAGHTEARWTGILYGLGVMLESSRRGRHSERR